MESHYGSDGGGYTFTGSSPRSGCVQIPQSEESRRAISTPHGFLTARRAGVGDDLAEVVEALNRGAVAAKDQIDQR